MQGTLHLYDEEKRLPAFISEPHGNRHVIIIGGMTDGFFTTPFVPDLAGALPSLGWTLCQCLLSSSYSGYGISSLIQDVEEMDLLIGYLVKEKQTTSIVLMGHSTGCQDCVAYMKTGQLRHLVRAVILQAPASDRECPDAYSEENIRLAATMVHEGKAEELMPMNASDVPITASRFYSLTSNEGDDDLFSSDLSAQTLVARLGHMRDSKVLILFSGGRLDVGCTYHVYRVHRVSYYAAEVGCWMYVPCAPCVRCTACLTIHYTLYTIHYTLYTILTALYSLHCTALYSPYTTLHCTHHALHCTVLTMHCTVLSMHCTVLSIHCTVLYSPCTALYSACTVHCTVLTIRCTALYSPCTALYSPCTALYSAYTALHCTHHALHCTHHALHCTQHALYTALYSPCTALYSPCTAVYCTHHALHCTHHTLHCTVLTMHCTVLTMHCTVLSIHCTALYSPCTALYLPCTVHCTALYSPCTALHCTHYALYSPCTVLDTQRMNMSPLCLRASSFTG
jgi:hypothetical protein